MDKWKHKSAHTFKLEASTMGFSFCAGTTSIVFAFRERTKYMVNKLLVNCKLLLMYMQMCTSLLT